MRGGHQRSGNPNLIGDRPPSKMSDRVQKTYAKDQIPKWKEISHNVEELGTVATEKKNTSVKSCKECQKRTEMFIVEESLADDAKVEEGDSGRIRKNLEASPDRGIRESSCIPGRNAANSG